MSGFGDFLDDFCSIFATAAEEEWLFSAPMVSPDCTIIPSSSDDFVDTVLLPEPIPDSPPLPSLLHSHNIAADGEGGGEEGDSDDDVVEIEAPIPPPLEAQLGDEERGLGMQTCSGILGFREGFFTSLLLSEPIPDHPSPTQLPSPPRPSTLWHSPCWAEAGGEGGGEAAEPVLVVVAGGGERENVVEIEGHIPPPLPRLTPEIMTLAEVVVRGLYKKTQEDSSLADSKSRASKTSHIRSKVLVEGGNGPNDVLSATGTQNSGDKERPSTSSSSRVHSKYGKHKGETTVIEHMNSADAKHNRRKLQNREAARRSRKRKDETMAELVAKVFRVKNAHASLLKECEDLCKGREDHDAELEAFNAKVKMGEETYQRSSPLAVAVTIQDEDHDRSTHERMLGSTVDTVAPIIDPSPACQVDRDVVRRKMRRTPSLQRVSSQEHIRKRVRNVASSSGPVLSNDVAGVLKTILFMDDLIKDLVRQGTDLTCFF